MKKNSIQKNNTGNYNSGSFNTGNRNVGSYNSGYFNTGDYNSGEFNYGDKNTGQRNIGGYNTSDHNIGNYNTGSSNIGSYNTGNFNFGDYNSGDFNSGNYNTGAFNTETPKMRFFDKETEMTMEEWHSSEAFAILSRIDFAPTEWVWGEEHPDHKITGGYLERINMDKAFLSWWNALNEKEKEIIKSIPNFDDEKFYQITGIRV